MSWTAQQSAAIQKVVHWARDRKAPQVMRLFGYAGTGKTTLAKEVAREVPGTLFAAYTGKAALVLRGKGCTGASTIHSLIYKAQQDQMTGEYEYSLNPDSAAAYAPLIAIDECSMVGEEIGRDLLSYGTKVLVLGDPAQLPPVGGEGFFTAAPPDIMLTDIHRQAADSPIIRLSMDVREGRTLVAGTYGDCVVQQRTSITKERMRELVLEADQLLCGRNATRQTFNGRVRALKGVDQPMPVKGDKLVCLRNNRMKGLLNGGLWTVNGASTGHDGVFMTVQSQDDPDQPHPIEVQTPAEFFLGTEKSLPWMQRKRADEFTYGYALTVHKSQGSSWPNVLLFDESSVFREDAARHLYTGITRAAEKLTIII
ncbi:MAG: ATP-dependent RecD-like DNA helicase [Leptothrix sp. (in: b-proteobacteria)]